GGAAQGSSGDETNEDAKKKSDVNPPVSEVDEVKGQLLHLSADFENYKRQSLRREEEIRERATRGVLEDLLPVRDNFVRAEQSAETTTDEQSLKIGGEQILQVLQKGIKGGGAGPIDSVGKSCDPALHDAIEEIEGAS